MPIVIRSIAIPIAYQQLPTSAGSEVEMTGYRRVVVAQIELVVIIDADRIRSIAIPIADDGCPTSARTEPEVTGYRRVSLLR